MPSSLYQITDKTATLTNSFAHLQVLADNPTRAVSVAQDFLWELTGKKVERDNLSHVLREANLENCSWRILWEGELIHPGAYEGVLSDYAGATRYEPAPEDDTSLKDQLTRLARTAVRLRLEGNIQQAQKVEKEADELLCRISLYQPESYRGLEDHYLQEQEEAASLD